MGEEMTVRVEVPLIHYSQSSVSDLLRDGAETQRFPENSSENRPFCLIFSAFDRSSASANVARNGSSRFCDSMTVYLSRVWRQDNHAPQCVQFMHLEARG